MIDTDGSGDISIDELRASMKKENPAVTEAQVLKRFSELDYNHDGSVSKDEFLLSVRNGGTRGTVSGATSTDQVSVRMSCGRRASVYWLPRARCRCLTRACTRRWTRRCKSL